MKLVDNNREFWKSQKDLVAIVTILAYNIIQISLFI